MKINDGGEFFPTPAGHTRVKDWQPGRGEYERVVALTTTGITRRQWLAGLAMQALLAEPVSRAAWQDGGSTALQVAMIPKAAYEIADAMISHEESEKV